MEAGKGAGRCPTTMEEIAGQEKVGGEEDQEEGEEEGCLPPVARLSFLSKCLCLSLSSCVKVHCQNHALQHVVSAFSPMPTHTGCLPKVPLTHQPTPHAMQ